MRLEGFSGVLNLLNREGFTGDFLAEERDLLSEVVLSGV